MALVRAVATVVVRAALGVVALLAVVAPGSAELLKDDDWTRPLTD